MNAVQQHVCDHNLLLAATLQHSAVITDPDFDGRYCRKSLLPPGDQFAFRGHVFLLSTISSVNESHSSHEGHFPSHFIES